MNREGEVSGPPGQSAHKGKDIGPLPSGGDLFGSSGHIECGVDLVDISRIRDMVQRLGDRFLSRVWTEQELVICRGRAPELAARFAGKEAAMKALGTGIVGISWKEIEILRDEAGKPLLVLHERARARANHLKLDNWAISLTHSKEMACAMVVATRGSMEK